MPISVQVDLSKTAAWDGTKSFSDLDPGLYEVTTVAVSEKGKTFQFDVRTSDGAQALVFVPSNMESEANKAKMLAALLSHGAKEEKIKSAGAGLVIGDAAFVNRKAFLLVINVEGTDDKGRKKINDKVFLTPEQAAAWKKANATPAGAATNGAGTTKAAEPAPAASAAGLFD